MSDGTPIIIKKKKVSGHGGHHGGAWKVAYADFVTAMMAFFMVMWIMGLSDQTRAQIQGYFNDPLGFTKNEPKAKVNISPPGQQYSRIGSNQSAGSTDARKTQEPAGDLKEQAEKVKDQIQKELNKDSAGLEGLTKDVEVNVTDEGLEIQFIEKERAFFEVGSAVLSQAGKKLIARIAPILASTDHRMMIDGHTDARPYPGSGYDNWDLSGDRANAMRRALKAGGVTPKQIVSVRANADTKLRKPEDPYDASNRRVTVLLPYDKPAEQKQPETPIVPESPQIKPNLGPKSVIQK